MKILNAFDAVQSGTFEDFLKSYNGDINQVEKYEGMNLLLMAMTNAENPDEKLKMIEFLLANKIDISYVDPVFKRNALHSFYADVWRPSVEYQLAVTKLLVENGIALNARDKYGSNPLHYAITNNKLTTEDNYEMYKYLLLKGADYNDKNNFGKSALDYAKEYSWRNGFLEIVREVEAI